MSESTDYGYDDLGNLKPGYYLDSQSSNPVFGGDAAALVSGLGSYNVSTENQQVAVNLILNELYDKWTSPITLTDGRPSEGNVRNAIFAADVAGELLNRYGSQLTEEQQKDALFLVTRANNIINAGLDVADKVRSFIDSVDKYNAGSNEETTKLERAVTSANAATLFNSTLSDAERAALLVTNPELVQRLSGIVNGRDEFNNRTDIGNSPSNELIKIEPGIVYDRTNPADRSGAFLLDFSNRVVDQVVEDIVAKVITEKGSISDIEYNAIVKLVTAEWRQFQVEIQLKSPPATPILPVSYNNQIDDISQEIRSYVDSDSQSISAKFGAPGYDSNNNLLPGYEIDPITNDAVYTGEKEDTPIIWRTYDIIQRQPWESPELLVTELEL